MQGAADSTDATARGSLVLRRHVAALTAGRRAMRSAEETAQPSAGAPVQRSPERIISGAIGRAAERVHGLPLFFDRVEVRQAGLAELGEVLPEAALILVAEGPAEALGAVAICPGLLASVIEMQAVGRVSSRAAPMRRPTRTDGAICADLVNACLFELGDELAALPGFEGLRGFRYASFLDDPRPLGLMLEDTAFHLLSLRLRAGDAGQRDGRMVIALPVTPAALRPAARPVLPEPEPEGPQPGAAGDDRPRDSLAAVVRSVPIDLVGVLCRRMISLGELRGLSPGDTIVLPADILGAATLETTVGQVLFRGKLGELAGRHALRLLGGNEAKTPAASGWTEHQQAPLPALTHEPPIADLEDPDAFREGKAMLPVEPSGLISEPQAAISG
ncbi:FliM/FliN family flagellar motor switch protein [Paracoccus chinensis]|uniref:Flagellar motor switch protein FliM n=1 Tax=Paracoccus chinensis TaxID=525640 RepID=A0A1G9DNP5_9RHOB|nr:FliM/FliN family flagellar motor C-terminal domain-containing protein [Paracoccus chinensis]SDK65517.1 flagellar motor switch protein FliM [Paracoccus chinensis]